jgi:glycosyltransferase involved in cell wall biosynthesis
MIAHRQRYRALVAPTLSVVMAARDAEATIADALRSLASDDDRPDEVIVVDDGSSDRTAAIAEGNGARVIRLPRPGGLAAAHNAGARAAVGEVLAFLDADDEVVRGWCSAMRRAFDEPRGARVVAGDLLPDVRTRVTRFASRLAGVHDLEARNGFVPIATGANLAMGADVLLVRRR